MVCMWQEGLSEPWGLPPTPKWIPEDTLITPANSERQAHGPHLGSQALPNALTLEV